VGDVANDTLRCQLALFAQIAATPVFSVLRTQEQLGYSVWSGPRTSTGSMGFHILLQGEKSAEYVETRIEAFFDHLRGVLESMTDEQFETVRSGLVNKQMEKAKSLQRGTLRYWDHMRDGYYDFERREFVGHKPQNVG
jgi:insulysin